MELDRFKAAWSRQSIEGGFAPPDENTMDQLELRDRAISRKNLWRDAVETTVAILVAAFFGWVARYGGLLMQVGAAIVIAAAAVIVIVLHTVRRRGAQQSDANIRHRLQGELRAVERQIRLLRNVVYWYIGPLFLGGLMFGVGITISLPAPAGVSPGTLLALGVISQVFILGTVGGAIYWLNQVAVRRRLEPLREELVRSLVSLSE